MDAKTKENQETWNVVFENFIEASALPHWGPFGIGEDLELIPEIKSKTFLEVGCGSGRSIKYLVDQGATRVYGLDFSEKQLEESRQFNKTAIDSGKVALYHSAMERHIDIEPVDVVISIYALGWTLKPEETLANIFSYLKPGGTFIWSWDHSFFSDVSFEDGKYVVTHSYHEESPIHIKNWKKEGRSAHIAYRKSSTWFALLKKAGFEVVGYYEPAPRNLSRGHNDPTKYYSIQKASLVPSSFIFVCRKP